MATSTTQRLAKRTVKLQKPKLGTGERFKRLVSELSRKGIKQPEALAASIGRKKYGKKKFQMLATKGK